MNQDDKNRPSQDFESRLAEANKELYERNVELAIRNRTLSVLRIMYEIINTSLKVKDTAQKLIEAVVSELKFQEGFIALADGREKYLKIIASSSNESEDKIQNIIGKRLTDLKFPFSRQENFCVNSLKKKRWRMTNAFYDILTPAIDEQTSNQIQEALKIQTSFIFPLVFAGQGLGVLVLGMDKHVGDLSRAERETMKELVEVVAIAIERAQIYADLEKANTRLKELDQLKDEFVSMASHELRTPMTAIKSYLWMTIYDKKTKFLPEVQEYLNRAYISTERLINLVSDMLNVSRIESGRYQLTPKKFDLVKLASEVYSELTPKAKEKEQKFNFEKAEKEVMVEADPDKIHQVLLNLAGNALKFTPEKGEISIQVVLEKERVSVLVVDNGPGITRADQKKLFQKFSRLENSFSEVAQNSGTGLGLYISKQIIEMSGGKIWVNSEKGKGSTFGFTLPYSTFQVE